MRVFSFSAKAGHGKDFCAGIAQEYLWERGVLIARQPLALPLKMRAYAEMAGRVSYEDVFFHKPPEVRERLQQAGTQEGRNRYGLDFWLFQAEALLRQYETTQPYLQGVCVPDVRFPNEVEFVRLGGRAPGRVRKELWKEVERETGFTEEKEQELLESRKILALWDLDRRAEASFHVRWQEALTRGEGMAFYIRSDRPTLTGEAATHESEIALDEVLDTVGFTAVLENWTTTTRDELKEQIVPHLNTLFGI